jgi:Leucine-rich repeat (LRR) protein
MFSKEEKQNIAKIKKLIRARDFEKIEMGIELVRSINNPKIFDDLLGNVEIEKWGRGFKHEWKGAGPDEHYFQTAILGLLNFSPKGSKGYEIKDSVQNLLLEGEIKSGYSYERSKVYLKYLSNFSNLKILKIKNYKEIVGFEEIYVLPLEGLDLDRGYSLPNYEEKWGFKKLKRLFITLPYSNTSRYADDPDEKIELKKMQRLDFLSNLTSLEAVKISGGWLSKSSPFFSIKGLSFLKNLKFFYSYDLGIDNVNDLNTLKNLNYVKLSENNLTDISGLTSSTNLEFLDVSNSDKLSDISPLSKLKNIKLINLSSTSVKSLDGLKNCVNLHGIDVQSSPVKNFDGLINAKNIYCINAGRCKDLVNIEGIKNSLKLKEIMLNDCPSLLNLKGLENCEDLRSISVSKSGISNLDSLINCKKIFRNNSTKWDEETPEWVGNTGSQNNPFGGVHELVEKVGYGNLYQAKYIGNKCREYYSDRDWSAPTLNEFEVHECPNLDSVEGLKNSGIQLLVINGCPSIKKTDYLAEFPLLQCCDFTDCANLESVESLSNLNLMDRLILKKCYKVKPKPRFLLMDSFEKVNEYLSKFKKNISEVKLSPEDKIASEKLEKLLLSDDYSDIELGLELANSISNKDIFNYLLEDVKFLNNKIVTNSKFLGNDKTKEFRDFALEGLISIAPDSCKIAKEIKGSFKTKILTGSNITSLLSVSGFSNLEKLTVKNTNISTISDLSRLKNLKTLLITDNPELKNLSGISGLDNLELLGIRNCKGLSDLSHVSGFKKLSGIQVNNCGINSTNGLKNLPLLKNVNLNDNPHLETIDEIGQIGSLEIVTISGCLKIKSIVSITKLANLSFLRVDKHNLQNTDGISSLIKPLMEGLRKE